MSTLTGSATEPTSTLTVPTVGGDTDTWGAILNGTSLQALLNYILWLYARATGEEVDTTGATDGDVLTLQSGVWVPVAPASGSGDVTGPAGATAGNFPDFDDATGKLLGDSGYGPASFATAAQGSTADTAVQPGDDAADLGSGAATDGYVLTADGAGGAAWEAVAGSGDMTKAVYDTNDDGTVDSADEAARVVESVATDTDSTATHAFDLDTGTIHELTLTANCTVSFTNVPTGGFGVTLILIQDATGSRTVTWPAAVQWAGGTAPTLTTTANAVDVVTLFTPDSGTTWYGFLAGLDFS